MRNKHSLKKKKEWEIVVFKNVNVVKDKERLCKCSGFKLQRQLNTIPHSRVAPYLEWEKLLEQLQKLKL